MVFSSLPFLYALFPVVLVAYFLIPNRVWRNSVLLVSSVFFYAWGEPKFVLLMMAATLVASVPIYIVFLLTQKYFISGLLVGSVKG